MEKAMMYLKSMPFFRGISLLLSFVLSVYTSDCPNTWVENDGSCYLFVQNKPMSFYESQHYCSQHKANLVILETVAENLFIKDYMRGWKSERRWLGLTDETTETLWDWYNGGGRPVFTDWGSNEPNSNGDEDCVVFDKAHDYQWADVVCARLVEPICEKL